MADLQITDLDPIVSLALTDVLEGVDVSDTTDDPAGSSGKLTVQQIVDLVPPGGGNTTQLSVVTSTLTLASAVVGLGEVDIYSFDVPMGTFDANDSIHLCLYGDLQNNTGGNVTYNLRTKIAGTTVMNFASGNVATGGTRRNWQLDFVGTFRAANDLWASEIVHLSNAVAQGSTNSVATLHSGTTGQITTDFSSANRIVSVTAQQNVSGSDIRINGGYLRRVKM